MTPIHQSDMTNADKLQVIIEKASTFDISIPHLSHPIENYKWDDTKQYWYLGDITIPLFEIIYQHDFAKALWGEQTDTLTVQNNSLNVKQIIDMNGWRYHLQQTVIAEDPIDYMYATITK